MHKKAGRVTNLALFAWQVLKDGQSLIVGSLEHPEKSLLSAQSWLSLKLLSYER